MIFLSPSVLIKLWIPIEARVEAMIFVEAEDVTLGLAVTGCYTDLLRLLIKDVALFNVQPTLFAIEEHEFPSKNRSTALYCLSSCLDFLFFPLCYKGFLMLH